MMMKRFDITKTLTLILIVLAAISAGAQSFELMGVRNVVQGRRFALTFRLKNAQANPPQAPHLAHCRLFSGPEISTTQYSVNDNGRQSYTIMYDFTYLYIADETGRVTVPSISVNSGGKKLSSRAATFEILPPDKNAQAGSQGRQGRSEDRQQPQPQSKPKFSADDLLVRVSFSKNTVYEQEAVVATIKVYTRLAINDFRVVQQPEFEGFLSEELPVNSRTQLENYNGQNYYSAELKKCLLYPQKSGTLRLNTGKYDVTVVHQEPVSQGFWVTMRETEQHVTTTSNAATINVMPLPEPRPDGFSGAVGNFSLSTELNPELMKTNEASTYSYIITGTGNIKYIPQPELQFPASFDAYTPKTDINAKITGNNTTGTYRVDYTLVPQETGRYTIPAHPFIYFNPEKRQYVTVPCKSYDVNVARGSAPSQSVEQKAVDANMADIRHIKPLTGKTGVPRLVFNDWWYRSLYGVAVLALLAVVLVYRRHARLSADVAGRRLARASRVANKRFKNAARYMKAHDARNFYDELAVALKGYVSDKLGIPPSQLISDTIASRLEGIGVSVETADEVISVLNDCEMARFTPDSGADDAMSSLYDRASRALQDVENSQKK